MYLDSSQFVKGEDQKHFLWSRAWHQVKVIFLLQLALGIEKNGHDKWCRNLFFSIGSLGKSRSRENVQDITVNGAYLHNTDNGVRIKTWQVNLLYCNTYHFRSHTEMRKLINLPFYLRQGGGGSVSRITFQNILMKNVSNPIIIDQYYCDSPRPCHNQVNNFYWYKLFMLQVVTFATKKG